MPLPFRDAPRPRPGAPLSRSMLLGCAVVAWMAPLAYFYGRDVYGSYLEIRAIDTVQFALLLRYDLAELMVSGAVLLLLWNRGRTWRALAIAMVLLVALVHFAQYRALETSSNVLTPSILRMTGLYEYAVTPTVTLHAMAVAVAALASLLAALRALRVADLRLRERLPGVACLVVGAAIVLAFPRGYREASMAKEHGLRARSPVAEFVIAVAGCLRSDILEHVDLGPADLELARSHGLPIDPGKLVPLARAGLAGGPVPFPRTGSVRHPNVLVLFIESLSANLLEPYGLSRPDLTPNISELARHAMRVDDYFNHTIPTVRGVRGQLCSTFPGYGTEEWEEAGAKLVTSRALCLPQVLREGGYDTAYLSHAQSGQLFLGSQFIDLGFRDLRFRDSIMSALLPEERLGRIGQPTDHQMFRALVRYLEQRSVDRPLFLALSTVQTHVGWDVLREGFAYGDRSNRVLNTIHNLDHAFGEFWTWFVSSRYAGNTILVLTGDHALWPHEMARRAVGPGYSGQEVDRMALFIRDPTHDLPPDFRASTSSIDLAPSLLHLLEWESIRNAFAGVSMFTERKGLLGGMGEGEFGTDTVLYWENGGAQVVSGLKGRCRDGAERNSRACSARRILEFLHEMDRTGRLWRE